MTHTIGPTPIRKKLTPARTPAGTQIVSTITTAAARLDHARRLKADGSVLTKLSVRALYGGGTPHVAAEFRTRRSPSVRAPALPAQSCPGGRQGEIEPSGSIRPSEGGRSPPPRTQRTSSVSRRPSPTRLMASTVSARKRPGKRMIQNASCTYVLPSAMMLPHEGMWGGVPAPRNDRYASNRMHEAQM